MKKISGQIKKILVENFLVDNCLAENVLVENFFLMHNHFPGNSSDEKKIWRFFLAEMFFGRKFFTVAKSVCKNSLDEKIFLVKNFFAEKCLVRKIFIVPKSFPRKLFG